MLDIEIKKPPVLSDRGRKIRGTTSGLVASHGATLTASNNALRDLGRTRPSLLNFQKGHSGRYFGGFSHCLAPPGSSLAEKGSLTCSHHCVEIILTKVVHFVKNCFIALTGSVALKDPYHHTPPQWNHSPSQKTTKLFHNSISLSVGALLPADPIPPQLQ